MNVPHTTTNPIQSHTHYPAPSPVSNLTTMRQSVHPESLSNGKIIGQQQPPPPQSAFPMPVLRTQPPRPSSSSTLASTQERASFKPIEQQQSSITLDSTSRPTPIYPQNSPYPTSEKTNFVNENFLVCFHCTSLFHFFQGSSSNGIVWSTNTIIELHIATCNSSIHYSNDVL